MTTLGCVLLQDRSLVFAPGLEPQINSQDCLSTTKTSPRCPSLVILPECLAASSAIASSSVALAVLCPPGFTAPNANAPLYTTAQRNSLFVLEFGESEKGLVKKSRCKFVTYCAALMRMPTDSVNVYTPSVFATA